MFLIKIFNKMFAIFLCMAIGLVTSCSIDNNDLFVDAHPDINNRESVEALLSLLSNNWGSSKTAVKEDQHKYLFLLSEDSDFLKYTNINGSFFLSYYFKDDKLATSLLLIPSDNSTVLANQKLSGYEYLGDMDGAAVYTSESAIASVLNCDYDGKQYFAVGLTPSDGRYNLFETIDPITVTTCPATSITTTSLSLNGSFTGMTDNPVAYIKYSFSEDMSSGIVKKCAIIDHSFSYNLTGLKPNQTIYYYAYIVDEGITYEGNIESAIGNFSTLAPPSGSVDLGLSVFWASCNLGASKPTEYGGYYQWAGTEDVSYTGIYLGWINCPYHTGLSYSSGWNKYNTKSSCGTVDNKKVLEAKDDAASVALGGKWRIPTETEWSELRNTSNCSWTWTTIDGVNGYKVQSKKPGYTDNWIFLPAAGYRYEVYLNDVGSYGNYWSSSLHTDYTDYAYDMSFNSSSIDGYGNSRYIGQSVRPVSE